MNTTLHSQIKAEVTEVFSTEHGTIYQFDAKNCWYIEFAGKLACFDYKNLLKLKKAVYQIDIEKMLLDPSKNADLEILFICACDHCYVLNLMQIIQLKTLLEGTFVMLNLNHIIFDRLHRINRV